MSGAVATAVVYSTVAAAAIGVVSSAYQAKEQQKAADKDQDRRREAATSAKAESDRISRETKPEGESLDEVDFGAEGTSGVGGSASDFLIPKSSSALGTSASGRSGLGFKV